MAVAFDLRDWLQAACGNLSARRAFCGGTVQADRRPIG
jgi:hypothetical protein